MKALFKDVVEGIRARPARAGLAFVAIAAGMVALAVLLATIQGLSRRAEQLVEELGVNVFAVLGDARDPAKRLSEDHVALLASNLMGAVVAGLRDYGVGNEAAGRIRLFGVDAAMCGVRGWDVRAGRALDGYDVLCRERVVWLTPAAARSVGVGATLRLRETSFTVAGIVDAGGGLDDADVDPRLGTGALSAFVPLATARMWDPAFAGGRREVDAIFVRTPAGVSLEEYVKLAQRLLADPVLFSGSCTWVTPDKLVRGVRKLQRVLVLTLGSIAVLCTLLGGTTLMSLMIANVKERVPEIGLRLALGARRIDVAALFVVEGVLVCAAGALAGGLIGNLLLWLVGPLLPCPAAPGALSLLVPVVLAVGLGALFSYWPARLAASISPSEALRTGQD